MWLRGQHDLCLAPPRWRLSLPPRTSRPMALWQMFILYSELDGAWSHTFSARCSQRALIVWRPAVMQQEAGGLKLHDLTVRPDVPVTVLCLKCDRWALASHSPLAKRCWDTFRDTPTHGNTGRGKLLMGSYCLKMKFPSVRRQDTMCWDLHVWKKVCSPSYAAWILNNIVLSLFSPCARLVLQKKSLCTYLFPVFSMSRRALFHIHVSGVWMIARPSRITLNKRQSSQKNAQARSSRGD